jgi:TatA/E family protein of Tat protein translocase
MFGSLGVPELLLIFAVILIVFGPRRIPEIGRTLGKAMGEFRKATDELKNTIEREVRLEELKQVAPSVAEFTKPFESVSRSEPAPVSWPADAGVIASAGPSSGEPGVVESSSLPVVEEQAQPELSTADPLDDSATRRLDDPKTGPDDPEKAERA